MGPPPTSSDWVVGKDGVLINRHHGPIVWVERLDDAGAVVGCEPLFMECPGVVVIPVCGHPPDEQKFGFVSVIAPTTEHNSQYRRRLTPEELGAASLVFPFTYLQNGEHDNEAPNR